MSPTSQLYDGDWEEWIRYILTHIQTVIDVPEPLFRLTLPLLFQHLTSSLDDLTSRIMLPSIITSHVHTQHLLIGMGVLLLLWGQYLVLPVLLIVGFLTTSSYLHDPSSALLIGLVVGIGLIFLMYRTRSLIAIIVGPILSLMMGHYFLLGLSYLISYLPDLSLIRNFFHATYILPVDVSIINPTPSLYDGIILAAVTVSIMIAVIAYYLLIYTEHHLIETWEIPTWLVHLGSLPLLTTVLGVGWIWTLLWNQVHDKTLSYHIPSNIGFFSVTWRAILPSSILSTLFVLFLIIHAIRSWGYVYSILIVWMTSILGALCIVHAIATSQLPSSSLVKPGIDVSPLLGFLSIHTLHTYMYSPTNGYATDMERVTQDVYAMALFVTCTLIGVRFQFRGLKP